ncbi:MAG: hypothetical protein FJ098_17345, partial [Deltaproteobacteria bacterium]|nr:hypothetical protein [Deltaproteobacteria bacterium]
EGCLHAALDGTPCTPVDPCIAVAACVDGLCTPGEELDCDDGNPCTGDSCVTGAGCLYAALDGVPCSDGSVCTSGDLCAGDTCTAPEELPCDDGNECTLDLCHPVSGCYHELGDNPCCDEEGINVCDDGNYCTTDSCDPGTGECFHAPNSLPCDDQDPCTGPDLCGGGACAGAEKDCGDGNSCTADWCQPGAGCIHQAEPDASACDDGLECSTGDHCLAGQCVADLSACGCLVDFSEDVSKVTALSIGTDGHPGHGLDVDGLPGTCEPAGSCSAGIDNSLSLLGGFANEALQAAVEDGSVIFLFEHRGFSPTGQVFEVVFHIGELAEPGCAFQTEPCVYLVDAKAFDAECLPLVALDNAQVNGAVLSAGGPGYAFPLVLPLSEGVLLDVTLYSTQLSASVTFSAGKPAALSGVLAGAISKAGMIEALEAVPEDQLPMDKDLIIQMIQGLVKADIDTDGDGAKDAASVGLPFQAISGSIAGFSQE